MARMNTRGSILAITTGFVLIFTLVGYETVFLGGMAQQTIQTQMHDTQAFWLAEAGSARALTVLRNKILIEMTTNLAHVPNFANTQQQMQNYLNQQAPMRLLADYANALDNPIGILTVNNGIANLDINAVLPDAGGPGVPGNYEATVTIRPDPDAIPNPLQLRPLPHASYRFYYVYTINTRCHITGAHQTFDINRSAKQINLNRGQFSLDVQQDNFSRFALFTNHQQTASGQEVWFTPHAQFSGPVHTNGNFYFAGNPAGIFDAAVTQHEQNATFFNNDTLNHVALDASQNGNIDVPTFNQGFQRGVDEIKPTDFLDINAVKNNALGGMDGAALANGVYVPNDGTHVTGGIFIQGDSAITMGVDGNHPVYTITPQGATTATTIRIDTHNNRTIVETPGNPTQVLNGIPHGMDPTQTGGELIYSTGNVTGFSGTVQRDSLVTLSCEQDVVFNDNVVYEQDPRIAGNENAANLLGVISWGGNVVIGKDAPNNLNIQGVIMAPSTNPTKGVFTVDGYDDTTRPNRGSATLLGGVVSNYYGAFGTFDSTTGNMLSGYARNFVYDTRMAQGHVPLYFPFINNFVISAPQLNNEPTWQEG